MVSLQVLHVTLVCPVNCVCDCQEHFWPVITVKTLLPLHLLHSLTFTVQETLPAAAEPPVCPRGPGQPSARHAQLLASTPSKTFPARGIHRPSGQQEAPDFPPVEQSGQWEIEISAARSSGSQRRHTGDRGRRPQALGRSSKPYGLLVGSLSGRNGGGQQVNADSLRSGRISRSTSTCLPAPLAASQSA